MHVEAYGSSKSPQGRTDNEDAFLTGSGKLPFAVVCDGEGTAQQSARKAVTFFENLFKGATPQEIFIHGTWARWIKTLDSILSRSTQSTFVGLAVIRGLAIGACAGNSHAYLVRQGRECRWLTEGANEARLGSGSSSAFPIREALSPGDTIMLLSDGVWSNLSPSLLNEIVLRVAPRKFSEVPNAVLDAARRAGTADDMTAVALRLLE
jgi:serine/threonine protein phosphatase PrpC